MTTLTKQDDVVIRVMDRNYKVKCPADKIAELQETAAYLDSKMREVIDNGKISSIDRVAVIAALNITHELLTQKQQNNQYIDTMNKRIMQLQNKISEAFIED